MNLPPQRLRRLRLALSPLLAATLFLPICALPAYALPVYTKPPDAALPATAPSPGQALPRTAITGTVQDPTTAIISGAAVQLLRPDGSTIATTSTDSSGRFQLAAPPSGDYTLVISLAGFSTLTRPLHIVAARLAPLILTMDLASVATNVTVNADQDAALADPASNADSATVTSTDMKNLPIFDADIVATLSAFLDAGAAGEGGTTLVIDGVESRTVGVAPSAIQSISVNQDPYSAQYRQPGRGQVEIVTKTAEQQFHGTVTFTFRDAAFEAKNFFSTTRPPSHREIYEGFLTGPTGLHNTNFLFSLTQRRQASFSQVDASTIDPATGAVLATPLAAVNVPYPVHSTDLTLKLRRQYTENHSGFLLYRFHDASTLNQGVGGQSLQTAGYASYNFDMDLTYHDDLTLGANKLNQFNILFERNLDRIVSNTPTTQTIIQGVATFGGAQSDQFNTENNPNLSDIFSWTLATRHPQQLKFGIQLPNLGRRILDDHTNRQGTYTFTSLAAYQAGTPGTFTLQYGQSRFETLYAQPGAFILDIIQLTPRLTLTPGLRYEFQNTISATKDGFQPRLSAAYILDPQSKTVLRTGSGLYFRHVGVNIGQQVDRYQNAAERSLVISNPCYVPQAITCSPLAAQPPSLFHLAPGMQSPVQAYFGLSLERQLTKASTLSIGYNGYRGWHALRSIDVNAPLPPYPNTTRPNPAISQDLQLDSGGYQKSDDLNVSLRGRFGNVLAGFLQYDYQHADSNTQWSTFQPQDQRNPNAEWSRTDYDQRQRLSLFATLYPDKPVTLGLGFYDYTPLPYTITTGTDPYDPGLFNARPAGVPRNSLNAGDYQDLQLRLGYTHKFAPLCLPFAHTSTHPQNCHLDRSPTASSSGTAERPAAGTGDDATDTPQSIAFSISSFNTLNRVNFESYDGVQGSPDFMQPTTANSPRRLQFSAAYNF